jgi:hypothetical protein
MMDWKLEVVVPVTGAAFCGADESAPEIRHTTTGAA